MSIPHEDLLCQVSFFKRVCDNVPQQECLPWPAVAELLTQHDRRPDKDGPLWSPAKYRDGATRGKNGVESLCCLVLDFDTGVSPQDLIPAWTRLEFITHSTFSHTHKCPKWRAVFPLIRSVPAEEWFVIYRRLAVALGGGHADPACKDPSRIFYLPAAPPGAEVFAFHHPGELLDPAAFPEPEPDRCPKSEPSERPFAKGELSRYRYAEAALEQELAELRATPEGNRNNRLNQAAFALGQLVGAGLLDRQRVEAALEDAGLAIGLDPREVQATIRSGLDAGEREPRQVPEFTYHPPARREWTGGPEGHRESEPGPQGGGDRPTKRPVALAVRLIDLARREATELFMDPREETYASLPVPGGGRACYPIRSTSFRRWLASRAMKEFGRCSAEALTEAVLALDALAAAGPRQEVFLRIAHQQGRVCVDLGNELWQAIEITAAGWRIVSDPPVRFVRGKGMLPLPRPEGDPRQAWDLLRQFVNISDEGWPLLLGFLAGCWGPGPYPILSLAGEQGAGKSTVSRILKSLLDPNIAIIRREPREDRDVCISAAHQHLLAFDNLSGIPVWLSDLLSAITSGTGYSKRTLYSDADETLLTVQRPIIVNGIGDLIHRSDLLDRAILLTLDPIPENRRRPEADFWQAFEAARPTILAGMCEAVSCALRRRDSLRLESLPRLADFSTWVAAAEPALGLPEGAFLAAYRQNRQEAHVLALEGNATAEAVIRFMADRDYWEGTAAELLRALFPPEEVWTHPKDAPTNARTLASILRRLAPNLRAAQGIEVGFSRSKTRRTITLRVTQGDARVTQGDARVTQKTVVLRHPQNTDQERVGEAQTPWGDAGDADFRILSPRYKIFWKGEKERGERGPEDKGEFASPASPPPVGGPQNRMNTELERVTQNQDVCVTPASPCVTLRHPTYDNTPGSSESLLRQAEALGWPAVALGPGKGIVGPGSESWERFVAQAPPEDLDRAAVALRELLDPSIGEALEPFGG